MYDFENTSSISKLSEMILDHHRKVSNELFWLHMLIKEQIALILKFEQEHNNKYSDKDKDKFNKKQVEQYQQIKHLLEKQLTDIRDYERSYDCNFSRTILLGNQSTDFIHTHKNLIPVFIANIIFSKQ